MLGGCAGSSLPSPEEAARAYADAAKRGDSAMLHEMLSEQGRRALAPEEVARIVVDQRAELAARAAAVEAAVPSGESGSAPVAPSSPIVPIAPIEVTAAVSLEGGETATFVVRGDRALIRSLPSFAVRPTTPAEALVALREALETRSFVSLLLVLSRRSARALGEELTSLLRGLERPEELEVDIRGDSATVEVPGGHAVKLRLEDGAWRVEDFD